MCLEEPRDFFRSAAKSGALRSSRPEAAILAAEPPSSTASILSKRKSPKRGASINDRSVLVQIIGGHRDRPVVPQHVYPPVSTSRAGDNAQGRAYRDRNGFAAPIWDTIREDWPSQSESLFR
jgi:hypothetical protein